MGKKRIYLSSPHMSEEGYEKHYIKEAFDTNWIAPLGENVDAFEKELVAKINKEPDEPLYAAALSSGTAAIHLALKAVGVGEGDIVLCQDLTFSATVNPVIYQNATPVFIDSDHATWNMDPALLRKALGKYKDRVKAVMVVHLYGIAADMDPIIKLCQAYNVPLIEDAAESLGTTYKGRHTGTFGQYGIYSFNGNKIITTSGGGILVARDKEKISKARFWATQSRDAARHYEHSELGFNYRMSNVLAGIGRGQLKVLEERIQKKRYIYKYYKRELENLEGLSMMPMPSFQESNCWLSCITLKGKVRPIDIIVALEKENIESRPLWKPMHQQPFFEKYDFIGEGISKILFETGLCLPSDTKMTDEELDKVIAVIKGLF
ncbi:aminotransferase DegT [Sporanaerobium hydrogeniformans]|uniref:Aminotransferase DegT n=1 Tax=Sporanaerobium hydrogeniformans TaxID=3072179 RepID=A0AC61DC91_9FIRM|nr:aminotransferase class V-fold PLP-dependent enzyme [Sporanaerobium hydrogeniformans]PHV70147.1 aminotransferase DegT [Sporanaerobium hydrogeniformans]